MAATDALFWYAESALPIFRPVIAGLYVLDRPPAPDRFGDGVELALSLVPRLRQRVVEAPWHVGLPEWVDDPHFDLSYHLRHIAVPPPGSERQLLDVAAAVFATPLDRERPLWEAYWIDGLSDGRAAFFFKLHHSVVDGVGSITLLRGLTQASRGGPLPRIVPAPRHRPRRAGSGEWIAPIVHNAGVAGRLLGRVLDAPRQLITRPGETLERWQRIARGAGATIADLVAPPIADPLAAGCSGLSRRFDVMRIPLARLRRIKDPLQVTINDLVLAVLAGTLGSYHRQRHARVETLNCMVPMNLRASDERDVLGNRVGTFTVRLPLAERDPCRRLELVARQTRAAKGDRRGAASPIVLDAVALLPGFAFRWLARQSLGKVNIACTNVPGVAERRYMAGARVDAVYPFASVVEGTPLVIALLSYAETMFVGIDTDPEAIPDPERLHALFESGLEAFERLAGVTPGGRPHAVRPRHGSHGSARTRRPA